MEVPVAAARASLPLLNMAELENVSEEMLKDEIAFLKNGQEKGVLFKSPMNASEAGKQIEEFTKKWPEPFAPNYGFTNPWASKKENKGKKDRPAGPVRPKLGGNVTL